MLHKMGYDCYCETCKQPKTDDEIIDKENGICETCHDAWLAKEYAYWKPLYDGEVLGGFHNPEKDKP